MTTRTEVTVRYAETDAQGVVHHANYLVWFEEGRSDFLRQNGLNYTGVEKAGFLELAHRQSLFSPIGQPSRKIRQNASQSERQSRTKRLMRRKSMPCACVRASAYCRIV